jgi:hypothetical protein
MQAEAVLKNLKEGQPIESHELMVLKNFVFTVDDVLYGNHGASWLDIFVEWQRSAIHSKTIDGLEGFLEDSFVAPIRK